jgi:outer membrane receptor protein involved in Fe transport
VRLLATAACICQSLSASVQSSAPPTKPAGPQEAAVVLDKFVVEEQVDDPLGMLPERPVEGAFGFQKSVLDTPRSVSLVSAEVIDAMSLSAVEDLVRVVPGVFTVTRFGIQGGIDVRSVPGDTFFRGMKRINLQGHGRSVLAAMDSIEVVKGPPSPIYGMGKIGGYTNMVPKAGRAKTGGYLSKNEGVAQVIAGSYDKFEVTAGVGGPLELGKKHGGFYIYGLLEDSDAFIKGVSVEQKILQAAVSIDDLIGKIRFETGFSYQLGATSGAFPGRITQDWIDAGSVITGTPLVNLDTNNNGAIGFYEYHMASPVRGNLSGNNAALSQRFNWPKDPAGNYYPLGSFPTVAGIPKTMYDYLVANPAADPTGLLRAQGVGSPLPVSGQLPVGFVLDPRNVGLTQVDYRRPNAYERDLEAEFIVAYLDLIYDVNPDFTFKNQFFFDSQDQYKVSGTPSGGKQDVYVLEEKATATYRASKLPSWIEMNTLLSVNFRHTRSTGYRYGGDFGGGYRVDAMGAGQNANANFAHPFDNPDINADGAPWTSSYRTEYFETGIGGLLDFSFFEKLNLMVGGRWDGSHAQNRDHAAFAVNAGTSANPGRVETADSFAKGWDTGTSWSASLSYKGPHKITPYFTAARASLMLEGNNNSMDNAVIIAGHIGEGEILEAGIKTSLFNNKIFITLAAYEQSRTDVTANSDSSIISAEVSSTVSRGSEIEIKWVPNKNFSVSFYALAQKTVYDPVGTGTIWINASWLGFQDVVDPVTGKIVYYADAFGYGGKLNLAVPQAIADLYPEKQGVPENQFGLNSIYTMNNGLGVTFSGNYFSGTYSGRWMLLKLPPTRTANIGMFYKYKDWRFKLDVFNVTDDLSFRARSGGNGSETLITVNPDRRFQFTLTRSF